MQCSTNPSQMQRTSYKNMSLKRLFHKHFSMFYSLSQGLHCVQIDRHCPASTATPPPALDTVWGFIV